MKFHLFLDAGGMEQIAMGRQPNSWNFDVKPGRDMGKDSVWVGDATVSFPSREQCAAGAIAALEAKKRAVYEQAAKDAAEYNDRIQNLLALPAPEYVTILDDIPF